ncbi:MAG: hypothetical protein OEW49_00355 [Nitrosopumilus sp.]|nr:hypothetical protein [Nitrosopumilus sp.]
MSVFPLRIDEQGISQSRSPQSRKILQRNGRMTTIDGLKKSHDQTRPYKILS